jgi:hypothetical protein
MIALCYTLGKRIHRITHQPNIEVELADILFIALQPHTSSLQQPRKE